MGSELPSVPRGVHALTVRGTRNEAEAIQAMLTRLDAQCALDHPDDARTPSPDAPSPTNVGPAAPAAAASPARPAAPR